MREVRLGAERLLGAAAVAVGNFDGVHRGHQALVARAVARARERGLAAAVLTFSPHPARLLAPEKAPPALMSPSQRRDALAALGVDVLAILPFTHERAQQAPAAFVHDVLASELHARVVVVGDGFRFGAGRAGTAADLTTLGTEHGFSVETVAPVCIAGLPVSSTRIREAVAAGDVATAAELLGRPFTVRGPVVHGDARGRTLGFPTANVDPESDLLPLAGVYACEMAAGAEGWPAVANVGRRPTFGGGEVRLEAHALVPPGDLYGRCVDIRFHARLRGEVRFAGKEALVTQIRSDVAAARAALGLA